MKGSFSCCERLSQSARAIKPHFSGKRIQSYTRIQLAHKQISADHCQEFKDALCLESRASGEKNGRRGFRNKIHESDPISIKRQVNGEDLIRGKRYLN